MENQVKTNKDNDLKNRPGLYDKDKKDGKDMNESAQDNEPSKLEYFTE